ERETSAEENRRRLFGKLHQPTLIEPVHPELERHRRTARSEAIHARHQDIAPARRQRVQNRPDMGGPDPCAGARQFHDFSRFHNSARTNPKFAATASARLNPARSSKSSTAASRVADNPVATRKNEYIIAKTMRARQRRQPPDGTRKSVNSQVAS